MAAAILSKVIRREKRKGWGFGDLWGRKEEDGILVVKRRKEEEMEEQEDMVFLSFSCFCFLGVSRRFSESKRRGKERFEQLLIVWREKNSRSGLMN